LLKEEESKVEVKSEEDDFVEVTFWKCPKCRNKNNFELTQKCQCGVRASDIDDIMQCLCSKKMKKTEL